MDFLLLGPVELRVNGDILELGSAKVRCLVAALALEAGRTVSRDTLVEYLWDDAPPKKPLDSLRVYVSHARGALHRAVEQEATEGKPPGAAAPGPPAVPVIDCRAHSYSLKADRQSVDWYRYRALSDAAQSAAAAGNDEEALRLVDRAESLWRGEALAGLPGLWPARMRRELAEARRHAILAGSAASMRLGRFEHLVPRLRELAEHSPSNQVLVGHLMLALYAQGRDTEALKVHERTIRALRAETGAVPGPGLSRIHAGILQHRSILDLVREFLRASSTARFSLNRSPATETSVVAELQEQKEPRALPSRNLPGRRPLVGRRTELIRLSAAVDTSIGQGTVVTLETVSGMAGVGKTAVAVHAAYQFADRFPDAQLYINLQAHLPDQDPLSAEEALGALLRRMRVPATDIPVGADERSAMWQALLADRRAVIVLDDAASVDQILPLLPGDSPTLVIITSRLHLDGLPDAFHVRLDALPSKDAIALFRRFAGEERTRDIREVTRVVRLCGCLPLAIELVANRLGAHPSWSVRTISDRLARTSGRLSEIHDARWEIARAFELSYRTLNLPLRTAFRRLSLHPGSEFSSEAAAVLLELPLDAAERQLESLLTCHLLQEPTPNRYRYHDLLAEYARSLAHEEDSDQERSRAMDRLIDYYLRAASYADRLAYPHILKPAVPYEDPPDALPLGLPPDEVRAWFETERGTLLAIENYARTHGSRKRAALLGQYLAAFLDAECHWEDAKSIAANAAAYWRTTGHERVLCQALLSLSTAHEQVGEYSDATAAGEEALRLARKNGDVDAEAEALLQLGVFQWQLGDVGKGTPLLEQAYVIRKHSGSDWDRARLDNALGSAFLYLGDYDSSLAYFCKAVQGFRELGDKRLLGKALNNTGNVFKRMRRIESARQCFEEAIPLLQVAGNRHQLAGVNVSLADLVAESGDSAAAISLHKDAVNLFRSLGDRKNQASALNGMGELYQTLECFQEAIECHRNALDIAEGIGAVHEQTIAHRCLSKADLAEGRMDSAVAHLRIAITLADRTHDRIEGFSSREALADLCLASGDLEEGVALLEQAADSMERHSPGESARLRGRSVEVQRSMEGQQDKDGE